MMTKASSPTPRPTLIPEQPSTPDAPATVAAHGLTILTQNGFTDSGGAAHVVGKVYNDTTTRFERVTVTCVFYDRDGQLLAQQSAPVLIDILLPEEKAPFKLSLWDPSQSIERYFLSVSGQETTAEPLTGIEFVQDNAQIQRETLVILGQVINNSPIPASDVQIAAAIFDREGQIIDVAAAHTARDIFVQGSISPFALLIEPVNGEPERYELIVHGKQAPDDAVERLAHLELTSTNARRNEQNDLVILGEVANLDQAPAGSVKVFAALYDENETLVDVGWTHIWAEVLAPGARSPFGIELIDPAPGIERWQVWVQGTKHAAPAQGSLTLVDTDNTLSDSRVATFTGRVRNDGSETMTRIEVAVTIYDAEGQIVAAGWDWLDGDLAPETSTPFAFEVETNERADSFALYVQGTIKPE
jgi:hypothetical protein